MDLSIIIVNWNSKDYLRKCIASILKKTHGIEFEILVIDSGSFDGCGEMLNSDYPEVQFIQSDKNLGFASANNLAFHSSKGKRLLFLNPDTELVGKSIEIMYWAYENLPHAGVLGCKLLNSDHSLQTSCIQSFPNILNQMLDSELLRQHFPHSRLWGIAPLCSNSEIPAEVDAVSGACLLLDRCIFEAVGLFSTDYFMYSEDIDLCFKVSQFGLKNYYLPCAVVVHHGGASSAKSEVSTFSCTMMVESTRRLFVKHKSKLYGDLYRVSMMLASSVRILATSLAIRASHDREEKSRQNRTLQKWNSRLRWALGLETGLSNF